VLRPGTTTQPAELVSAASALLATRHVHAAAILLDRLATSWAPRDVELVIGIYIGFGTERDRTQNAKRTSLYWQ
jgi:hypothetical protein